MTNLWYAQYAQLAQLNWQLHQQHRVAAWQANLHQALHETEQMAHRVSCTLPQDLFAAAVLARSWLIRIHGLDASAFHDFNAKRAYAAAFGALDGAVRAARNDGRAQWDVDNYFTLMDRVAGFQRLTNDNPSAYVESVRSRAATMVTGEGFVAVGILLLVLGLAFLSTPSTRAGFLVFGLVGVVLILIGISLRKSSSARAAAEVAAAERYVAEFQTWFEAPEGGGWLKAAWRDHPLLFEHAVPPPPTSQPAPTSQTYVERKVVERQIVVVRCRFCRQLSPVDRPTCEHCGAAGFGSAQA